MRGTPSRDASFPILLTTGFYDIYTGGIFDMWRAMTAETRARCALVVSPYDHPDRVDGAHSVVFPSGQRKAQFGAQYEIDWFDGHPRQTVHAVPAGAGNVLPAV